jgi:hypothetical protein
MIIIIRIRITIIILLLLLLSILLLFRLIVLGVCTHLGCVPIPNAGEWNGFVDTFFFLFFFLIFLFFLFFLYFYHHHSHHFYHWRRHYHYSFIIKTITTALINILTTITFYIPMIVIILKISSLLIQSISLINSDTS